MSPSDTTHSPTAVRVEVRLGPDGLGARSVGQAQVEASVDLGLVLAAIPVPAGVATGVVRLTDERRLDVPVLLVCSEFSPEQAQNWLAAGDLPELARAKHLEFVDIDSGHWPMFTKPTELARVLVAA